MEARPADTGATGRRVIGMDIRKEQLRDVQLDVIASVLVVALLTVIGLLLYGIAQSGAELSLGTLLSSHTTRTLLAGFALLALLYLWDQRQRLRAEVQRKTEEAETISCWLALSHGAACALGRDGVTQAMDGVLGGIASLLDAEAVAVLGDDVDFAHIRPDVPAADADRALMHVVVEAVGHPEPSRVTTPGVGGQSVAVPLRIGGELRCVLCAWRRGEPFTHGEMDALGLAARTIELAIEREEALAEARAQLEGTLRVLQLLGAGKCRDWSRHSMAVADLGDRVAARLGMTREQRKELRLASLLHDVGIMSLPPVSAHAGDPLGHEQRMILEQHPRIGAEIAMAANFSDTVQRAILGHHERIDGGGYPAGSAGAKVTLEARILGVCEAYESLAGCDVSNDTAGVREVLREILRGVGSAHDPAVVEALVAVVTERSGLSFDAVLLPATGNHGPACPRPQSPATSLTAVPG